MEEPLMYTTVLQHFTSELISEKIKIQFYSIPKN